MVDIFPLTFPPFCGIVPGVMKMLVFEASGDEDVGF